VMTVAELLLLLMEMGWLLMVVVVLVEVGNGFSWIISFAQIPQTILEAVGISQMGPMGVLASISVAFFVACMFRH